MTYKELRWDVGDGPIQPEDRIKPLIESIPKELMIRMRATKKIPAKYYYGDHSKDHGHDGTDLIDQPAYDVSGVVVSLNPDVMIVCFRERKYGPQPPSHSTWDVSLRDKVRSDYIDSRSESIRYRDATFEVNVGTLLRWSEEMYVVSNDPMVGYRRVKFENDKDVINFRTGKLILRHHDEDVDVSRD